MVMGVISKNTTTLKKEVHENNGGSGMDCRKDNLLAEKQPKGSFFWHSAAAILRESRRGYIQRTDLPEVQPDRREECMIRTASS